MFGGDVVEGDLAVGDGDEALEDGGLEVGENEVAVAATEVAAADAGGGLGGRRRILAVAPGDVAHHGRQGPETQVSVKVG